MNLFKKKRKKTFTQKLFKSQQYVYLWFAKINSLSHPLINFLFCLFFPNMFLPFFLFVCFILQRNVPVPHLHIGIAATNKVKQKTKLAKFCPTFFYLLIRVRYRLHNMHKLGLIKCATLICNVGLCVLFLLILRVLFVCFYCVRINRVGICVEENEWKSS